MVEKKKEMYLDAGTEIYKGKETLKADLGLKHYFVVILFFLIMLLFLASVFVGVWAIASWIF